MSTDKIKPPDVFPALFKEVLARGEEEWRLGKSKEKPPLLALARRYRAFLRSLAYYPLHPLNKYREGRKIRTRIKYEPLLRHYALYIISEKEIDWDSARENKS